MNQNKIIGLTGIIGSGKTTVAEILKENGFYVIDVDKVYHELLEKNMNLKKDLVDFFGNEIVVDSEINRDKLRQKLLSNPNNFSRLNAITHPYIFIKVKELTDNLKGNIVIDAALLFEIGLDKLCNELWYVNADIKTVKDRIKKRNDFGDLVIETFIKNQENILMMKDRCNVVIDNNCSIQELKIKIKKHLQASVSDDPED